MSNTNRTPFASALSAYLNHSQQADGKQMAVLAAMLEMETSFSAEWCENFHKATGKTKTSMIHATLDELYPEFAGIKEDAKEKLAASATERQTEDKKKAQEKLKALENIVRGSATALAFFFLKPVTAREVKGSKLRWASKDKNGETVWNNRLGDTFKELKALGREATDKAKWTEPAPNSAPRVNTPNSPVAGEGSSVAETLELSQKTDNRFADAFRQMCNGTANLIEAKKLDELSEGEQEALRRLEQVVIRKIFANSKGVVDVELIAELYNSDQPVTEATPEKSKKSKKASKANGKAPMTAAEAEALQAPASIQNVA